MSWFNKHKGSSENLSDRAIKVLKQSGWYSERKVNITTWLDILTAKGFEVFPVVQDFLKCFSGLILKYEFIYRGKVIKYQMHFDAEEVCGAEIQEDVSFFSQVVGSPLCPIGSYDDLIMMMDKDGKTYGCQGDGYVFFLGNTGIKAIDNVITYSNEIIPLDAKPGHPE